MNDIVPWKYKARCLLVFSIKAHNDTWRTGNPSMQFGRAVGISLMLSFSLECALKALLEENDIPITKKLWKHNLHMLFSKLPSKIRTKTSSDFICEREQT